MVKAIQNATWQGVPPDISAADVNATFSKTACTACQLAFILSSQAKSSRSIIKV
jgi:hypothetical protein